MDKINKLCSETKSYKKYIKFDQLKKGQILKVLQVSKDEFVDDSGEAKPVYKAELGGNYTGSSIFLPPRVTNGFLQIEESEGLSILNNSFLVYNMKTGIQNTFAFKLTIKDAKRTRREEFKISTVYSDEDSDESDDGFQCGQAMGSDLNEIISSHKVGPKSALLTKKKKQNQKRKLSESSEDDISFVESQAVASSSAAATKKKRFSKEDLINYIEN